MLKLTKFCQDRNSITTAFLREKLWNNKQFFIYQFLKFPNLPIKSLLKIAFWPIAQISTEYFKGLIYASLPSNYSFHSIDIFFDDLHALNDRDEFHNYYKQIYPKENHGNHASFLDLDITVDFLYAAKSGASNSFLKKQVVKCFVRFPNCFNKYGKTTEEYLSIF